MKTHHRLRPDLAAQLRDLFLLKDHHARLAAQQDAQIAALLRVATGADIEREQWELSADCRLLTRRPTPALAPCQASHPHPQKD